MKVVCGSCGAKYSVADDKVAGKTVKIRCKKCSETIVVRGDQNPFEEDEATRVFDYGSEAVWHAVVNGEQQGPFAPVQISGLINEGKIDAEAYVWKEGLDGWKPLKEVPELAPFAKGGAAEAAHVEADVEADAPAGGDLFGGGGGGDLFSGGSAKSSAFAAPDDDDGVVASKPSPRVSADEAHMTGQRNENSVLFSLSNLQALASSPKPAASSSSSSFSSSMLGSSPSPAAAKPAGHAGGDASGLIDIRALASATSNVSANKPSGGGSANIDDLLSMGGPSPLAGGLAAPLLAPPPAAKRDDDDDEKPAAGGSNKALLVGGGVVLLLLLVAVGGLAYKVMQPPQVVTHERIIVQNAPGESGGGSTETAPAEPNSAGSETAAAATDTAAGRTTGTTGRTAGTTGRTGTTGTTGTTAAAAATTAPAAATTMAAETPRTTGTTGSAAPTDRMRALLEAMTTAPTTTMTAAPASEPAMTAPAGGAATPSRSDVGAALGGLAGQVRGCGGPAGTVASVSVTFASNGSVRSAAVGGELAGTPAAGCISRIVRGAHVPPFSNPSFSVTYPYRL